MKKQIIILFLCLLAFTAYSQQYYPLIEEGRSWNVLIVVPSELPFDTSCYTVSYLAKGDTIINSVEYKKMYSSNEKNPVNWNLHGFIREDVAKKVWYKTIVDANEALIYDFSILAGDSLKLGKDTAFYYKVDSITTGTVASSLREKYWISQDDYSWRETWIEGIGSNKGILGSAMATAVGGWSWLLCVHDNGSLVYMNPNHESCYIKTDIDEINKTIFNVYPNPFTDVIEIDFDANIDKSKILICIYNSIGQKVVNISKIESNQLKIDLSNMPSGIYYLAIQDESRVLLTQKQIKL
ncbi:MAG: T9SS type A sorting domain-containing protein [Bacteroidales bacterium]|jgi:hypothetical protein|nr:T9SS type A sorting domain-containing protein [Bacteroidales bacterium]